VEAIILAGGKAERLGAAAGGKPKSLVSIGGRPLAAHQIGILRRAGVRRVIVSCAAGKERSFESALSGLGVELAVIAEPEPLGRGGGLRFAAQVRSETGDVYALNGDELLDVDLDALLGLHRAAGAAATLTVAQPRSPFGVVQLGRDDRVTGFTEAGQVPYWVSCGVYVLGEEALERLPERGDHETMTFPELAAEGRLQAFRHHGVWLTVNTPKDLRRAEEYVAAQPDWLAEPDRAAAE
jgi:NDP-sugar pyrophosphorylase family protein